MSQQLPRFCHLCGRALVNAYRIYATGRVVCSSCETSQPRCERCRLPAHSLDLVGGAQLCAACRGQVALCGCCGRALLESSYLVGDPPMPYCERCMQERPRCGVCHVPLNEQGHIISGRHGSIRRCAGCFSQAVYDEAEAQRLYDEIVALLARALALQINSQPLLLLVERAELIALGDDLHPAESTAASESLVPEIQYLYGLFERKGGKCTIYIESYLPRSLFQAVVAHELTHAWQDEHVLHPQQQPLLLAEGFAEWVAYRTMLLLGRQRTAARLTRRDDLYGQGLQYFLALERQYGRQAVLRRALDPSPLPLG
jgi:hypothetical protein